MRTARGLSSAPVWLVPAAAALVLGLAGCSGTTETKNFPHLTDEVTGYLDALLPAELEIVETNGSICPYLHLQDGDKLLLVLEQDAEVTANSITWGGNELVSGQVVVAGGEAVTQYEDVGCERTDKVWLLAPAISSGD